MVAAGRDRGSATLTTVLLTPVAMMVALMAFQAALWTHARTEARAIARDAAVLVARTGGCAVPEQCTAAVERSAQQRLDAQRNLSSATVDVTPEGDLIVATVDASAPGIFRFTERRFQVVEAVPFEEFRQP